MTSQQGPDVAEKVRAAVDIVTLISEAVPLKKAGRKYRGLCPFHNEKTPSFYVDETKQLFYCFGCGTGGDTFKFVMLRENVDFPGALRMLARRAGIALPEPRGGSRSSEREAILAACRSAAALYSEILISGPEGDVGRNYLARRGISVATREELGLGFAPDRWDTLRDALARQGHRSELLLAAGLLLRREDGSGFYDRFRNRIIFPILNLSGDVVGFGGRLVAEGEPKYLNSPETLVYNKRENLYGLHHSRQAIKEAGEAVVVEGYLDFASLWQAGVRNVVATLGTSFTDEQAALLRRFSEKVVVNYDADPAGRAATKRSLEGLLARGFAVRVLELPSGKDPDAFLRSSTPEAYRELVEAAPTCFDFLVAAASREKNLADPASLAAAVREVVSVLAQVPDRIERSQYVAIMAERFGLEDALLLAEIRNALLRGARPGAAASAAPPAPDRAAPVAAPTEAETRLVRAVVESEPSRARISAEILPADLEGTSVASIVMRALEIERNGSEVSYPSVSEGLSDRERGLLAQIGLKGGPVPTENEAIHCLETLRRARLVRERSAVQKEMERSSDPSRLEELLRRKIDLSRQIDSMS